MLICSCASLSTNGGNKESTDGISGVRFACPLMPMTLMLVRLFPIWLVYGLELYVESM
jgi:hypothetical protein